MFSIDISIGIFCLLSGVILIMDYGRKRALRLVGIVGVLLGITSFFQCCAGTKDNHNYHYQIAHGYFVRNEVEVSDIPARIDNNHTFEKFFGTAALMGPDGLPTSIDFSKNTIIPIVLNSTDSDIRIKVENCIEAGDTLFVRYKVLPGERQSYVITPMELLIVGKLDNKTIVELVKE